MSHSKNRTYLPELAEDSDRKKKVRNLVRDFLKSNGVGWSVEGAKVYGIQLINAVSECLWYIDGHHETLAAQSCSVPSELSHIQGHNKPETHGHKRKSSASLNQPKVMEHSLAILHLTKQSYMKQDAWLSLREIF